MYCKKCGQQLSDGAAFCGNCGTPVKTQNQNPAADIGGSRGEPIYASTSEMMDAQRSGKKKGGKKVLGILMLCLFILLAGGVGGGIFVYKLNQDSLYTDVDAEETKRELEEPDEADEEGSGSEKGEKEDNDTQQKETAPETEAMPEAEEGTKDTEPVYNEEDDGKVNTYELIVADVTWTDAYNYCLVRGGHLVRINSEEEYQAILQQIEEEDKGNVKFWLGGKRSTDDAYEYRWIYEDGTYGSAVLNRDEPYASYWLTGEPSFYDATISQDEMYMNMFYVSKEGRWVWNDVPDDLIAIAEFYSGTVGYICEYEE
ncbi:MAG: zinc-ribbon domain-containing protein [Lachnospiraceae bacterium]|nr:zinc-ribbon domain-containing protein [Lachnospiraceae bacterium]MDE6184569.1 zinc-ribbon domain-containing protein [Lachnospiraceae bacterium]